MALRQNKEFFLPKMKVFLHELFMQIHEFNLKWGKVKPRFDFH